jgi:rhodanese-related sulfurtransferase
LRRRAGLLLILATWLAALPAARADHGVRGTLVLPLDYVKRQFDSGRKFSTVDLRPADAYRSGHLPQARSIPLAELAARTKDVPTEGLVVLYCDCPRRVAEDAYHLLREQGWRNLSVMAEGFAAWAERGYPIER